MSASLKKSFCLLQIWILNDTTFDAFSFSDSNKHSEAINLEFFDLFFCVQLNCLLNQIHFPQKLLCCLTDVLLSHCAFQICHLNLKLHLNPIFRSFVVAEQNAASKHFVGLITTTLNARTSQSDTMCDVRCVVGWVLVEVPAYTTDRTTIEK